MLADSKRQGRGRAKDQAYGRLLGAMTHDEMREQYKELLLEIEERQTELAHLRHKVENIGKKLESFGRWLDDASEGIIRESPLNSEEAKQYSDLPALLALAASIPVKFSELQKLEAKKIAMKI